MMQRWLTVRRQALPDEHAMHMHGATLMPGMLTPEEMEQLAATKGRAFDRLFTDGIVPPTGGNPTDATAGDKLRAQRKSWRIRSLNGARSTPGPTGSQGSASSSSDCN